MLQRRLAGSIICLVLGAASAALAQAPESDDCRAACVDERTAADSVCEAEHELCRRTLAPPDRWEVTSGDVCAEAHAQCVRRAESDYRTCIDACEAAE